MRVYQSSPNLSHFHVFPLPLPHVSRYRTINMHYILYIYIYNIYLFIYLCLHIQTPLPYLERSITTIFLSYPTYAMSRFPHKLSAHMNMAESMISAGSNGSHFEFQYCFLYLNKTRHYQHRYIIVSEHFNSYLHDK